MIRQLKQALLGKQKPSDRAVARQKLLESSSPVSPQRSSEPEKKRNSSTRRRQRDRARPTLPPNVRPKHERPETKQMLPTPLRRDRRSPNFWQKLKQKAAAPQRSPTAAETEPKVADLSRLRQQKSQAGDKRKLSPRPSRRSRSRRLKSTEKLFRARSGRPAAFAQPSRAEITQRQQALEMKARRRNPTPETTRRSLPTPLLYSLRLLILGVGLGAISGTLLSALSATSNPNNAEANQPHNPAIENVRATTKSSALPLQQESSELNGKIKTLAQKYPQFQTGAFFVDLDTGVYAKLHETTLLAAASTIKLPILVAFFQDVDRGKISLDEMLTMREELIATEAGTMKNKQPGAQFSALETATKMITISDNTATNMLIDRLGGMEALNQRFRQWGLKSTILRNFLPDIAGTNTSSPIDLANLIAMVNQGDLVSLRSRGHLLQIMRDVETNSLLPRGLDENATIAHKTGSIGSLLADAGLVNTPTGKRYIAVVMVKRPRNDVRAKQLIRDLSRTVYQHFNQPAATPNTTNPPADNTSSVATEMQD